MQHLYFYQYRGRRYCRNSGATADLAKDIPDHSHNRVICSWCGRSVAINKLRTIAHHGPKAKK